MERLNIRRWDVLAFLVVETALYLTFLYLDLFVPKGDGTLLKYAGIALCAVVSGLWAVRGGDRLVALGMVLTLGADTFLLLLDRWYWVGMVFFCGAQMVYFNRLTRATGKQWVKLARDGLWLAMMCALIFTDSVTPVSVVGALYLSRFLCNVVHSFTIKSRGGRLFAIGLALYLVCDLWVGIYNLPGLIPAPLYECARVGMWLFYLPGQVLIALSSLTPLQGEMNHGETK